ncbi:MAG: hypothetical protein IJJ38_01085 [Lachnospiraceae bacterium]|nr:hypothetical protein [Lachnospiraceae bacterium]
MSEKEMVQSITEVYAFKMGERERAFMEGFATGVKQNELRHQEKRKKTSEDREEDRNEI